LARLSKPVLSYQHRRAGQLPPRKAASAALVRVLPAG